jgi:hypothetical protein
MALAHRIFVIAYELYFNVSVTQNITHQAVLERKNYE